jgi:hypothetical protein
MAIPPLIFRDLIYPAAVNHSEYQGGVEAGHRAFGECCAGLCAVNQAEQRDWQWLCEN